MNTKHSQKKRYAAMALLLSVVTVISMFVPMTAFAASSDAEVLTLAEDESYRFYCQPHNRDDSKCRVICIVNEEWLKNTPDFSIYLTVGNAYGRKETKSIGQPSMVYRSVKATEGDRVITYTPQEGAVLFGWIITNLPEGFSMKSADISSLEGPYTVTFTDYDGRVIEKVTDIPKGGSASLPQSPTKDNATFLGWSGTYVGVTKNETVRAVYDDETNVVMFETERQDNTLTVKLTIKGNVNFYCYECAQSGARIRYDTSVLAYRSQSTSSDRFVTLLTPGEGFLVFNGYEQYGENAMSDTVLFTVTFDILSDEPGHVWLSGLDLYALDEDYMEQYITYVLIDGVVNLE